MTDEEIAVIVEEHLCEEVPEFRLRLLTEHGQIVREAAISGMFDSITFDCVASGYVITALSYVVVRKRGEETFIQEIVRDETARNLPWTTNGDDLTVHMGHTYRVAVDAYRTGQYIRRNSVKVAQPAQYIKLDIEG